MTRSLTACIANADRSNGVLGVLVCLCVMAVFTVALGTAPARAATQSVLVYYANETTQHAQANSSNLKRLMTLLDESPLPLARRLSAIIASDLTDFRAQAERDQVALLQAARRIGFDVAIFTNTLAHAAQYLLYKHDKGVVDTKTLPELPPTRDEILSFSPLSRPQALKAALSGVAAQYVSGPLDIVLVTLSHGSLDMALMPRVNSDLSSPRAVAEFKLNLEHGGNAETPEWATPKGTGKTAYWNALAEVSSETGARFPLVFRQACGSGPGDWREFVQIPSSVTTIAHSARYNIDIDQINYAEVFAAGTAGADWIDLLSTGLAQRDITVSSQYSIAAYAALATLYTLHPALFAIPLLIWLAVYGAGLVRLVRLRLRSA